MRPPIGRKVLVKKALKRMAPTDNTRVDTGMREHRIKEMPHMKQKTSMLDRMREHMKGGY